MTNNNDTDKVTPEMMNATRARIIARLEARKATPTIMVPPSGRYYPKRNRRTSVPHRAIR